MSGRRRPPAPAAPPRRPVAPPAELEHYLLGYALHGTGTWTRLQQAGLVPADLWRHDHQVILAAAYAGLAEGLDLDTRALLLRVGDTLDDRPGIVGLSDGSVRLPDDALRHYVGEVKELALARRLSALLARGKTQLDEDPTRLRDAWPEHFRTELQTLLTQLPGPSRTLSVPLPELLAATDAPRELLVGSWVAAGESTLVHGQPRDGKSWLALECAVALATGTSALGVFEPAPQEAAVLVVGNEAPPRVVAQRTAALVRGRGIDDQLPDALRFLVHQGVDCDDPFWHTQLRRELDRHQIRLLILDPLRSVTSSVDQGPAELRPFAVFLRQLVADTGVAVLAVHHDVKPGRGKDDATTARKAQRASGGGLFSIADAPISSEWINPRDTLFHPNGFKHSADPDALLVRRTHLSDTVVQLAAEITQAVSAEALAVEAKILEVLRHTGGGSGRMLSKELGLRRETLTQHLEALEAAGQITSTEGPKRARLWCLTGA